MSNLECPFFSFSFLICVLVIARVLLTPNYSMYIYILYNTLQLQAYQCSASILNDQLVVEIFFVPF